MKPITKTIIWITLFSIAMGYLESAIVVYLRDLYYPQGFKFPLNTIHHRNAGVEFWREIGTLVMLFGVGYLAGKNRPQRFAFFIYSFAIWDLFYYVFLKAILNWPESFFTWDILFLVPLPWIGPVLAPCLVCVAMIILAAMMIKFSEKNINARLIKQERWLVFMGCLIIVISFVKDYVQNLYEHNSFNPWTPVSQAELFRDFMTFIPVSYSWFLFAVGELCIFAAIARYYLRLKKAEA